MILITSVQIAQDNYNLIKLDLRVRTKASENKLIEIILHSLRIDVFVVFADVIRLKKNVIHSVHLHSVRFQINFA